jgi:CRP/FNR family transcriptional regulator
MTVKGRLAQTLISLSEKFGTTSDGHINCNLSRQDLASIVGTAYETLFRTLNELEEENIIKLSDKKDIRIISREKLQALTRDGSE